MPSCGSWWRRYRTYRYLWHPFLFPILSLLHQIRSSSYSSPHDRARKLHQIRSSLLVSLPSTRNLRWALPAILRSRCRSGLLQCRDVSLSISWWGFCCGTKKDTNDSSSWEYWYRFLPRLNFVRRVDLIRLLCSSKVYIGLDSMGDSLARLQKKGIFPIRQRLWMAMATLFGEILPFSLFDVREIDCCINWNSILGYFGVNWAYFLSAVGN
jgi:hypothetical protein